VPVNHEWVSDIVEAAEEHDLGLLLTGKQQRPVSLRMCPVAAMKRMLRMWWTKLLNFSSSTCSSISACSVVSVMHTSYTSELMNHDSSQTSPQVYRWNKNQHSMVLMALGWP
jgi:hypothetical protein